MSFKLAISGKGGVGKSTLAGTLARLFAEQGNRVLAIDADPDANLASAIGVPAELRASIKTISHEKELIEERTGARVGEFGQVFALNPDVSGIAEQYGINYQGVDLLVVGAIQRAGGGCACPENVLLRNLVSDLVLRRNEIVVLDMEAGVEHMGRATAMGVDLMLVVVESGRRSVETAHRIIEMSRSIGIKHVGIVVNKSFDREADLKWMHEEFGSDAVMGLIPFDARIAEADRKGMALIDSGYADLIEAYRDIQLVIQQRFEDRAVSISTKG